MPGNVYVYNLNAERLEVVVNGGSAGTVGAWSYGEPRFQLAAPLTVPRARHRDGPGRFANEANELGLQWDARRARCSIAIDGGQYPLGQDLLLLITENHWQLVDDRGTTIASGPVDWTWG